MVVLMPAGLPETEERRLISEMLVKLARSRGRRGARTTDAALMERAQALSRQWLGGRAVPESVRWVPTMTTRWASCSPGSREIRISESLRDVPAYVLDYVLVHELAHLVVPGGHPPEFWELVRTFPRTERAMGDISGGARRRLRSARRGRGRPHRPRRIVAGAPGPHRFRSRSAARRKHRPPPVRAGTSRSRPRRRIARTRRAAGRSRRRVRVLTRAAGRGVATVRRALGAHGLAHAPPQLGGLAGLPRPQLEPHEGGEGLLGGTAGGSAA